MRWYVEGISQRNEIVTWRKDIVTWGDDRATLGLCWCERAKLTSMHQTGACDAQQHFKSANMASESEDDLFSFQGIRRNIPASVMNPLTQE